MKRKITSLLLAALMLLSLLPMAALAEDDTVITLVDLMIPGSYEAGMSAGEYLSRCYVQDDRYRLEDLYLWLDKENARADDDKKLYSGDWFSVHAVLVPVSTEYSFADGCQVQVNHDPFEAAYKTEIVTPNRLEMDSCYIGIRDEDPIKPDVIRQPADGYISILGPATFFYEYSYPDCETSWQYCLPGETDWQETGFGGTLLRVDRGEYPLGTRFRGCIRWKSSEYMTDWYEECTEAATLRLRPTITTNPLNQRVPEGAMVTLAAEGRDVKSWRWYRRADKDAPAVLLAGVTGSSLTFCATGDDNGSRFYAVAVSEDGTTAATTEAHILVQETPVLSELRKVFVGDDLRFALSVQTDTPYTWYEWYSCAVPWQDDYTQGALYAGGGEDMTSLEQEWYYSDSSRLFWCAMYMGNGPEDWAGNELVWVGRHTVTVTTAPVDIYGTEGSPLDLRLEAESTYGPVKALWQRQLPGSAQWVDVAELTGEDLFLRVPAEADMDGNLFRAVVTDDFGDRRVTQPCTVHVPVTKPVITAQPETAAVEEDETAVFSVKAAGPVLTYRWQEKKPGAETWTDCEEETAVWASLTVKAEAAKDGTLYRCVVGNLYGMSAVSEAAELAVKLPPEIPGEPGDAEAKAGDEVTFTVTAKGRGLTYAWEMKKAGETAWTALPGTEATLTLVAEASMDGARVRCTVTDVYGLKAVSDEAELLLREAPVITLQPEDATAVAGEFLTVKVEAAGSGLTYHWEIKAPGLTDWGQTAFHDPFMTLTAEEELDGMACRCIVTNEYGLSVTSEEAILHVRVVPVIRSQPEAAEVRNAEEATFSVTALGEGLTYAWEMKKAGEDEWTALPGTEATLTLTCDRTMDGALVRCTVTNSAGETTVSDEASLTVTPVPAVITAQPESLFVTEAKKVTFSVSAEGEGLTWQWQQKKPGSTAWASCVSATGKTPTLAINAREAVDGYTYRCVVTDSVGSVTSAEATLSFHQAPVITAQPRSLHAAGEMKVTFTVTAEGENLTYQWQQKKPGHTRWTNCVSATGKTAALAINAREAVNGYTYRCVVSDGTAQVTSAEATLSVTKALFITAQPKSLTVTGEKRVTFTVAANGKDLTWQWQQKKPGASKWANCVSATGKTDTLAINAREAVNGYTYRCVVSDGDVSVTSAEATLTVK